MSSDFFFPGICSQKNDSIIIARIWKQDTKDSSSKLFVRYFKKIFKMISTSLFLIAKAIINQGKRIKYIREMIAYRISVCGFLIMRNLRWPKPMEAVTPGEVEKRKERQHIIKLVSNSVVFSTLKVYRGMWSTTTS